MGTALWLVYFWKMTTFWGEKQGRDASEENPLTNNAIAKTVSFFPHLREQVYQFALHVDGLKGELLTGAVQKSRCDVLQRVRNRLQAVYLVTDHCTRKKSPMKSRTGKLENFTFPLWQLGQNVSKNSRNLSRLSRRGRQNVERDLMNARPIGPGQICSYQPGS